MKMLNYIAIDFEQNLLLSKTCKKINKYRYNINKNFYPYINIG